MFSTAALPGGNRRFFKMPKLKTVGIPAARPDARGGAGPGSGLKILNL
jgi:hypothetical protein